MKTTKRSTMKKLMATVVSAPGWTHAMPYQLRLQARRADRS